MRGGLAFHSGATLIPSATKTNGGEDAFFFLPRALGVADGLGGWADVGVDPGIYARALMGAAEKAACSELSKAEGSAPGGGEPLTVLRAAAKEAEGIRGGSTACILLLVGEELRCANLGDSGFLVVRKGAVAFQSPPLQHSFNFPYQLSGDSQYSDDVDKAQSLTFKVAPGDTVVCGTDGLFDNAYPEEICRAVVQGAQFKETPEETSKALADLAFKNATDNSKLSPWAAEARKHGYFSTWGGKMDDVTVVVSKVIQESAL